MVHDLKFFFPRFLIRRALSEDVLATICAHFLLNNACMYFMQRRHYWKAIVSPGENSLESYLLQVGGLLGEGKLEQLQRDLLTIDLLRRFGGENQPETKSINHTFLYEQ